MSKTKKIAAAVVSIVLASTMIVSLAACKDNKKPSLNASQEVLEVSTDANGALSYGDDIALNMNVGYKAEYGYITYREKQVSESFELFGKTYNRGQLKPAWQELSDTLGIDFNDAYQQLDAEDQINDTTNYSRYDMITGQADTIVQKATSNSSQYLDLSLYMDYMPNYKAFLEENPIVQMSIVSDTSTGAMYYAPYFDGNDDIEKYELAQLQWVERLLDTTDAGENTTFTASVSAKKTASIDGDTIRGEVGDGKTASVKSFMGTTGEWWVNTTNVAASQLNADGTLGSSADTKQITKVVVSYDDALAAAKNNTTELGKAVAAAGVKDASKLTSGNIVDLQYQAINDTQGAVTGAQLLNMLRAYIDVAYQKEDGSKFYATRSDVFNGYNAAWDADLLVALSRCIVTNTGLLGTKTESQNIYAIMGRENKTQRQNDLVSLAGELYGVRGLTPRYQWTYIDSEGKINDSRNDVDMWEALDRLNEMVEEGLLYTGTKHAAGASSYYKADSPESFMIYDYVQTQTANGGFELELGTDKYGLPEDYNFTAINTPVSKWDDGSTNDSGYCYVNGEKVMRFTESWRSVKNTGFCLPRANYEGKPEKLAAALKFIDYLFSNDGQILMTYGPQSDNNDLKGTAPTFTSEANGFWYGNKVTNVNVADVAYKPEGSDQYTVNAENEGKYFIYKNKVYSGTYYKGEQCPTMTDANLQLYYGRTVNSVVLANSSDGAGTVQGANYVCSYTNYARGIIGSALPIGNKLQSFEYQGTATMGMIGADKVSANLVNGTISHVYLSPDNPKGSYWYTIVPTTLPYTTDVSQQISADFATADSNLFANSSAADNILIDVIRFGLDGTGSCTGYTMTGEKLPASAEAMVTLINTKYGTMDRYEGYMQTAWSAILEFYKDFIK